MQAGNCVGLLKDCKVTDRIFKIELSKEHGADGGRRRLGRLWLWLWAPLLFRGGRSGSGRECVPEFALY